MIRYISICVLALLCASASANRLLYTFPYLPKAPVIDGKIEPGEWDRAAAGLGMQSMTTGLAPERQIIFYGGYDDVKLYVAVRIPRVKGVGLIASRTERDAPVYTDDSVELYVDTRSGKNLDAMTQFESDEYKHFVVNSIGTQYDEQRKDNNWNAVWSSAAAVTDDEWTVEFAIPWKAFGVDKAPPQIGLALGWNDAHGGNNYSWPPEAYHRPSRFADVNLKDGPAPRLTEFKELKPGEFAVAAGLSTGTAGFTLKTDPAGWAPLKGRLHGKSEYLLLPKLPEGKTQIGVVYEIDGLAKGRFEFSFQPGIILKNEKYYLKREVETSVLFNSMPELNGKEFVLSLVHPDGKTTGLKNLKLGPEKRFTIPFSTAALAPGKYRLTGRVDGYPQVGETELEIIEKPVWLHTRAGYAEDKVLAPWSPIVNKGRDYQIQGRTYTSGDFLFPAAISTVGKTLLERPITLKLNGKALQGKTESRQISPARMEQQGTIQTGEITVTGNTVFDYDGVWFSKLTVAPGKKLGDRKITLQLDIPLNPDMVSQYYTFAANWPRNIFHPVKQGGTALPFHPYLWLGNETGGLAWFTESAQHWYPANNPNALEIIQNGKETLLRANLIVDGTLSKPVTYNFGFQASPVVQRGKDAWDYRVERFGSFDMADKLSGKVGSVTYDAVGKITAAGSIELDFKPEFAVDGQGETKNHNLLNLQNSADNRLFIFWDCSSRRMKMFFMDKGKLPVIIGDSEPLKNNDWNHVKVSWGDKVEFYLNDRLIGAHDYQGFPGSSTTEARLTLGGWNSDYVIDDLKWTGGGQTVIADDFETESAGVRRDCIAAAGKSGKGLQLTVKLDKPASRLDQWAERGSKVVVFHENTWTEIEDGYYSHRPDDMRKVVKAIHEHDMKAILYFGFQLSSINQWFADFKNECLVGPENGGYTRQSPPQYARMVCYNSVWQDYLVWAAGYVMDEYDADGVYLDATGYVWPCNNELHGCGYRDESGRLHPTYPFMAVRQLMRRLYTQVTEKKPDGHIDYHNSTTMLTPINAWTMTNWCGEEWTIHRRKPGFFYDQITSLDNLRMNMAWRHFGTPTEFLNYDGVPFTFAESLALSLIHDIPTRPEGAYQKDIIAALAAQRNQFKADGKAVWYPYWRQPDAFLNLPANVKASAWLKSGDSMLVYITNLDRRDVSFELETNSAVTGIKAKTAVSLPSMGYKVLELSAK